MKYILIVLFVLFAVLPVRAERIAIAVLDLEAKGEGLNKATADAFTENIRYRFSKMDSIDLVAREKMLELTKEKSIQLSGCTDVSCAVQVGKALNVQKMIIGSLVKLGNQYSIYLKIVDIEKENVELSDKEESEGGVEDIDKRIPTLVGRLVNDMWELIGKEAVKKKPDEPHSYYLLGYALLRKGQYEAAENDFREGLKVHSDNIDLILGLGRSLGAQKRTKEAENQLREAVRLKPDNAETHYCLAGFELGQGNLNESEKECRLSISLKPNQSVNYELLGDILRAQNKSNEQTEEEYRRAIRIDPENAYAHAKLGNLFITLGRNTEAENELRKAIKVDPNIALSHCDLGFILQCQSKYEESEREFREALRLNPNIGSPSNDIHGFLGITLVFQNKLHEAEEQFREALLANPNDPLDLRDLALCLDNLGRRSEARPYWVKALQFEKDEDNIKNIKKRLKEKD